MLRPLPEQKSLVYFASGLRLNGVDNQAQLRATTNAAMRANVVDLSGRRARPGGDARRSATRRRPSPGGIGDVLRAGRPATSLTNFQRSQDTLYSLAKDTGGKAMFDYNDLSLGIVQAAQAVTSYYIVGFYSKHTALDGKFHRVKITLARRPVGRRRVPAGLLRRQGVREVQRGRQGAPARRRADARQSGHRHHDRDGGELLPAQSRRILRAGGREDSRQRAGAGAAPRRARAR